MKNKSNPVLKHYSAILGICLLFESRGSCADAKPYDEVYAARIMSRVDKNKDGRFEKKENEVEWNK